MKVNISPTQRRWYLIHCRPREDERALEHLQRQAFECYRPTQRVERFPHGRRRVVSESLFPGYFFIHLDRSQDDWRPIRSTRGVNWIVSSGGQPIPVPDRILDGIRQRLESDGGLARPSFAPGDRVQITGGAFSQIEGIFVAGSGEARVMLLLNILQQEHVLAFPAEMVRKIS